MFSQREPSLLNVPSLENNLIDSLSEKRNVPGVDINFDLKSKESHISSERAEPSKENH